MSSSPAVTLADIRRGEAAVITEIDGQDAVSSRLLEMGLTPDESIRLIGASPWGDPLEFEIRGYRISLRIAEAKRVKVVLESLDG